MSTPPRALGLVVGLTAMIVLAAADVLFGVILDRTPITPLTPLWVGLILFSLPALAFLGYRTFSLVNAKYIVTQNALVIVWGPLREIVPMGEITNVIRGKDIPASLVPQGLWWPGCLVGRGHVNPFGAIRYFATAPQAEQLVVATASGAFVLSPSSITAFLEDFENERRQGITEPVEPATHRPSVYDWELWRDRWAGGLVLGGLALPFLLLIVIAVRYPNLPAIIPLHFDTQGQIDRTGPPGGLFILPVTGGLVWLGYSLLGAILHVRRVERPAAYLLWVGSGLVQVFLWVAAIGLL